MREKTVGLKMRKGKKQFIRAGKNPLSSGRPLAPLLSCAIRQGCVVLLQIREAHRFAYPAGYNIRFAGFPTKVNILAGGLGATDTTYATSSFVGYAGVHIAGLSVFVNGSQNGQPAGVAIVAASAGCGSIHVADEHIGLSPTAACAGCAQCVVAGGRIL